MSISQPIYLYLNESLVDEVWTTIQRDGIAVERVKEVAAKLSAKGKFGLGKLWTWLASDLKVETEGEASGSRSTTIVYSPFLRAILLPELLTETETTASFASKQPGEVPFGAFVDVECCFSQMLQIPTVADHFRLQTLLTGDVEDLTRDELLAYLEKVTDLKKAFALSRLFDDDDGNATVIRAIYDELEQEFLNAMSLSSDDQILLISQLGGVESTKLVMVFLDERNVRRHLGGYTGSRSIRVFGKLASWRRASTGTSEIIGIEAISVALA